MEDANHSISPLPDHVASQIKSSTAIPSIACVVLGLIANSLDAGAHNIDISVDYARGAVFVEDNGRGIHPKEFRDEGGLGKLHHTSKYDSPNIKNGRTGTFLASVAALSILTITSHHCDHIQHATLILHHSRPAARLIPAPSHQHLLNREHGTRVAVQDLFGNMPVRVKQRVLESAIGEVEKNVERLKRQIIAILLAWHLPVSVHVKWTESNQETHIRQNTNSLSNEGERRHLTKSLDVSLVCGILSQARYTEPTDRNCWIKTSARTSAMTIKGVISLQPAPSKRVQFISLGLQPVNADTGRNVLYDEVNRLFASSNFGLQEDTPTNEQIVNAGMNKDRRFKQDGFTSSQLKNGGKRVDRWPMFYIRVEFLYPNSFCETDVDAVGEGTMAALLKILGAMVTGFLNENHFRPRARPRSRKPNISKCLESKKNPDSPRLVRGPKDTNMGHQKDAFSAWGRIKSGIRVQSSAAPPSLSSVTCEPSKFQNNLGGLADSSDGPRDTTQDPEAISGSQCKKPDSPDGEHTVEWTNPFSGATILVNARTGLVVDPQLLNRSATAPPSLHPGSSSSNLRLKSTYGSLKKLPLPASLSYEVSKAESWSRNILKKWENPVFNTTEERISQASIDGLSLETSDPIQGRPHCSSYEDIQKAFMQSSLPFSTRLSRSALKAAEVIGQVDRKFILISMLEHSSVSKAEASSRNLLILVDQHAADERIRVEGLLADLVSSPTRLTKPIAFDISTRENEMFGRLHPYFADWGIKYDISEVAKSPKCKMFVNALPRTIAERCRIEPKTLIELLRGEAWKREELGMKSRAVNDPCALHPTLKPKVNDWLARLSSCPEGLLAMVNSRACRSAIMFNDELTPTQCQTLVQRLGECAFPFQCAHGRPSMIPLMDMHTNTDSARHKDLEYHARDEGSCKTFGESWKRWRD